MAASIVSAKPLIAVPFVVTEIKLSGLTAGLPEALSHLGPSAVNPSEVHFMLTAPPTDGSAIRMSYDSNSTSANTVTVRFLSDGSLDGATVTVFVTFYSQATAGLNPPS